MHNTQYEFDPVNPKLVHFKFLKLLLLVLQFLLVIFLNFAFFLFCFVSSFPYVSSGN